MKGKFNSIWRVAVALVLVLSFSLVAAVPVAADSPADTDVGFEFGVDEAEDTAKWSTAMAGATGAMGNYSVELKEDGGSSGNSYVQLIPPSGITISDLEALTNEWGFWYHIATAAVHNGPYFELKFTSGTDYVDITVMTQGTDIVFDKWTQVELTSSIKLVNYWGSVGGVGVSYDGGTLAEAITAVLLEDGISDDWELTSVRVQIVTPVAAERTCYIDDITIDGTTYELEPIFLDAEYYSVGDTVEVTVPNFAANTDSYRINPVAGEIPATPVADSWTVSVNSDSDPDTNIIVALEETDADTGVFTASFGTSGTPPVAEDEVYVEDGATITVTYTTKTDPVVGWGTGVESTTTLTALVDDTAPTITGLTPADGATEETATPEIGASYSDPAGIDLTSVEMLLDGVEVVGAVADGSGVTYTPEDDLLDGTHDVVVNVSDNAGNAATKSWSFRIVSWLVGPESDTNVAELDALTTVGVAVFITPDTTTADIEVGRYASNPEPEAALTFSLIENGFFDAKVTNLSSTATQIVIKFADPEITADSTAYVWGELEGAWLECSDQGYNPTDEYLYVKVRDDTTPNIAELEGTPFAISGVPAEFDPMVYDEDEDGVMEIGEVLNAISDYFADEITITEVLEVITLYF